MVNERMLKDELKRIDDFFENLSVEEFEKMALDCGVGIIMPSEKSKYVEVVAESSTVNIADS